MRAIDVDASQQLWLGTKQATLRLDSLGNKKYFATHPSFLKPDVISLEIVKDVMYVGTGHALHKLKLTDLANWQKSFYPRLASASCSKRELDWNQEQISLDYQDRNLVFDFENMDFASGRGLEVKMDDEADWQRLEENRLSLFSLDQGDHLLQVRNRLDEA